MAEDKILFDFQEIDTVPVKFFRYSFNLNRNFLVHLKKFLNKIAKQKYSFLGSIILHSNRKSNSISAKTKTI